MTFKMKGFSGFGNSPMKNDGKLSKKKKDLKTGEDITPDAIKMPVPPNFSDNDSIAKPIDMPTPTGKKKKKNKSKLDSVREKYFNGLYSK